MGTQHLGQRQFFFHRAPVRGTAFAVMRDAGRHLAVAGARSRHVHDFLARVLRQALGERALARARAAENQGTTHSAPPNIAATARGLDGK